MKMKTIVITGGSSGIGRELALKLSQQGHHIIAIGRNQARLSKLASRDSNIEILSADIATEEGRDSVKKLIGDSKVDALINNAGLAAPSGPLSKVTAEAWRYQMSVNVEAPLFLSQLLLKNLVGGRILNMTIYSSYRVTPDLACYGTSKAALNRLTEYMRAEFQEKKLSVGLVLPGIVNTNIQTQLPAESKAHQLDKLEPSLVAAFLSWLILEADKDKFGRDVFDIYDEWHQKYWNTGPVVSNPLK